jgi:hypothetical protein
MLHRLVLQQWVKIRPNPNWPTPSKKKEREKAARNCSPRFYRSLKVLELRFFLSRRNLSSHHRAPSISSNTLPSAPIISSVSGFSSKLLSFAQGNSILSLHSVAVFPYLLANRHLHLSI